MFRKLAVLPIAASVVAFATTARADVDLQTLESGGVGLPAEFPDNMKAFIPKEGGTNEIAIVVKTIQDCDKIVLEETEDQRQNAERIAAARAKLAAATTARDGALAAIEKKKKGSFALDVVGIVGGAGATAGGALGIAKSKSIYDGLHDTAQSMQDCRDAIDLWRRQYSSFDGYCGANYDAVKDYSEYQSFEYARMSVADANGKCAGAFEPNDYYGIQSDLKGSGVSSGVALAGGVGTMVSSTGAIAADETADKKNWRIASTVSSGVSTIAGVVSAVVVNKIKKTLQDAKDRNAKCLGALDGVGL
ncbi:MAG: hypothetical protein LBL46_01990 [Rickettsiales bacterium]|jgi:hypothetical protein|nr:hypothetical protein [Rickettsiales bacterium]